MFSQKGSNWIGESQWHYSEISHDLLTKLVNVGIPCLFPPPPHMFEGIPVIETELKLESGFWASLS